MAEDETVSKREAAAETMMHASTKALGTEAASGFRSLFYRSGDGLQLHAREYDPGPNRNLPVVCLPGLARTSADFHTLALALSRDPKAPRRVISLDYRGRGLSDYDPDWKNYDIRVELGDLQHVLTAADIHEAVFVGTSRGGLLTMGLSAARPSAIRGAVLNDIGPVIEAKGLLRIRGYVGKLPAPKDFAEGARILRELFDAQFPAFGEREWDDYARGTWKETPTGLSTNYDPALMRGLAELDLEAKLPTLWPYFEGLRHVPVLSLRGALSDLLSEETVAEMEKRHPMFERHVVPQQGHAPILASPDLLRRISRFVARCDT